MLKGVAISSSSQGFLEDVPIPVLLLQGQTQTPLAPTSETGEGPYPDIYILYP